MSGWQCIGASVIGPAHLRNNLPNQDAWLFRHTSAFDCAVVADGLGSKKRSEIAALGICKGIVSAAEWYTRQDHEPLNFEEFLIKSMDIFDEEVTGLSKSDCGTTCLFCLALESYVHLAMLGDGLLAVLLKTGEVFIIEDDKHESFSNIVSALAPGMAETNWLYRKVRKDDCQAVLLCTDGISDDLEDASGFVGDFVKSYSGMPQEEAEKDIQKMLENWPVPKHSDDKTIVCLFNQA